MARDRVSWMACALVAALLCAAVPAAAANGPRHQDRHPSRQQSRQESGHHVRHHRRHRKRRHHGPSATPLAAGALDPSFGTGGLSTVAYGQWAAAGAAAVQRDGKIVTAGETEVAGKYEFLSTRMEPNGTLDPTYGTGGIATPQFSGGSGANAIALQPDGKVILAGAAAVDNVMSFAAVRLLPDGAVDDTFGHGGLASVPVGSAAIADAVAIQPDGKVVLGGTALDGGLRFAVARLNPDGSIDRTFGTGGVNALIPPAIAWGMTLEHNGDIVLAGSTGGQTGILSLTSLLSPELALVPGALLETLTAGGQLYMAARLLPDGRLDRGFGAGGFATVRLDNTAIAFAVSSLSNGDIVLAGNAFTDRIVAVVARLLPSGGLDRSYGTNGLRTLPIQEGVNAITVRPNGQAIVAGVGPTVFELAANGGLVPQFGAGGIATVLGRASGGAENAIALAPHNRIVLAGASAIGGRTVLSVSRIGG